VRIGGAVGEAHLVEAITVLAFEGDDACDQRAGGGIAQLTGDLHLDRAGGIAARTRIIARVRRGDVQVHDPRRDQQYVRAG
jgi:hypothetical protein